MSSNDVAVVQDGPSVAVARQSTDLDALSSFINKLIERNVDFDQVKQAVDLYERVERRRMETEYNAAMAEAQARIIPVIANRRNDHTKSDYADISAIAEMAMPLIHAAGFGISFSEFKSAEPNCLGVRAEVMHGRKNPDGSFSGGFAKTYDFNIPIDNAGVKGTVNKTDTQAYGSTREYGRRYAIVSIFNIATKRLDKDGNRRVENTGPIEVEQVAALQALMIETNSKLEPFLETFSRVNKVDPPVTTLDGIPSRLFLSAKGLLVQKKNEMAKKAQQTNEAA